MVDVTVTMEIVARGTAMEGVAELDGVIGPLRASARAVRHRDGSIDDWARTLVGARLLRKLEVLLMEAVHEHIDRSIANE